MRPLYSGGVILLLCSTSAGVDFPSPKENAQSGDFVATAARLGGVAATVGGLSVPENWDNPSQLIHLPVAIIHSTSREFREPIFVLHGGPGLSNIQTEREYDWALEHHDVVLVGY